MTRKRADIATHGGFLHIGPLAYANVARGQRMHARSIAACIERGEPFDTADAAAILRVRAAQPWAGRPSVSAKAARETLRCAADAIEAGEPFDAAAAANALREWADTVRDEPKRPRGKPPKHDHAALALEFEAQRRQRPGDSDNAVMRDLAEKYGIDDSTIKEARIACGDAARRHFDAILGRKKNRPEYSP